MMYGWAAMAAALCHRQSCADAGSAPRLADDLWSQLADYRAAHPENTAHPENLVQFPRVRTVRPRPWRGWPGDGRQASN
jgi:hypothetical protein